MDTILTVIGLIKIPLLQLLIQSLYRKVTRGYKFCLGLLVLPLLRPAEPVANPLTWAISFCAYSHVISFGRLLSAVSGFSGFIRTYMWLDPGEGTKITWYYTVLFCASAGIMFIHAYNFLHFFFNDKISSKYVHAITEQIVFSYQTEFCPCDRVLSCQWGVSHWFWS